MLVDALKSSKLLAFVELMNPLWTPLVEEPIVVLGCTAMEYCSSVLTYFIGAMTTAC